MWAFVKRQLNQYENAPSSILELWDCVQENLVCNFVGDCKRLYDNMLRQIVANLASKGRRLDIKCNLFCVCKIESISPLSLNFIFYFVSISCIHNFVRMLYILYTIPIDFFVSL